MGKYTENHKDEFPVPPTRYSSDVKTTEYDRIVEMIKKGAWWSYAGWPDGGTTLSETQIVSTWTGMNHIPSHDPLNKFLEEYVKNLKLPTEDVLKGIQKSPSGIYNFEEAKAKLDGLKELKFTPGDSLNSKSLMKYYEFYDYVLGTQDFKSLPPPNPKI